MRKHDLSTCAYYILYRVIMDAHHAHAHNSCRPDAALYSSPPLWRDSPCLPEEEWGTQAHRCWGIAMSSDLQVPFQTRKPGARRYTNFIVRNHYILAPGRETVRETSKSCVSRSNCESWEACNRRVRITEVRISDILL